MIRGVKSGSDLQWPILHRKRSILPIINHARILILALLLLPAIEAALRRASCARNSKGRIARSSTARHQFERSNPCPSTGKPSGACPGYVIDHKQALKFGSSDTPGNMQ
jgi:hypothetical protein